MTVLEGAGPTARRAPAARAGSAAVSRPNLVLILTDDQTRDSLAFMPQTRRLLQVPGTTFTNAFVSYPLCCPSRATLLTGQYAHNHGVRGNRPPGGGYTALDHQNTLPVWLQAAGYYTAHLGKYLNGYGEIAPPLVPPGWSRWFGLVDPSTYSLYDYTVSDDGTLVHHGRAAADYQTDVLAVAAEQVIRERAGRGPSFLIVAPVAPHLERSDVGGKGTPPRPAPRHAGRFADEPLPPTPAFDEADVRDKPDAVRRLPRISPRARAGILRTYRAQLAALLAVDDLVARLVGALAETGELDRTVIVFTSDNGFFHGEHRLRDGKFLPYEEAVRVPLLVRGGGFPAGAAATQLVANVDLAPTLLALAGVAPGRELDGVPLLPLALDPALERGRALLLEGLEGNRDTYTAVRSERWLWVEYDNGSRELYDLEHDPFELESLHAVARWGAVREELAGRLATLRSCAGESCR
ncbi:MAG TPA: sulfatase [Thermoanaerobaculia bacterium]|jgi:arylsulfatase A-like enzyme|nr:sulfatase [Thermoanaerobaculia bacterium]